MNIQAIVIALHRAGFDVEQCSAVSAALLATKRMLEAGGGYSEVFRDEFGSNAAQLLERATEGGPGQS